MGDDEGIAISSSNSAYQVRSGEWLPKGYRPADVSGDWVAFTAPDRRPWLAKLDTPTVVAAELPESHTWIHIFASGKTVHVFARRGWRQKEGPLQYLMYDFARDRSQPVKEMTLPWARTSLEMDPETGMVVITGNQRSWASCWLMDIKTGKRERISWPDWHLIVKKEVAQKWIELMKP